MEDDALLVTQGSDILGTVGSVFRDFLNYKLLDRKIDAEIARPFVVNDPSGQYALGANGQLYVRGTSAGVVGAPTAALINQLLVIGVVIVGGILIFNAVK